MRRCPVLCKLVGAALAGKHLRREEKVVLLYTIGLADPGGDALHLVLSVFNPKTITTDDFIRSRVENAEEDEDL